MAIIPIGERYDYETDTMEFVLEKDDYEKIRQGYGCSHCLCDYNGLYMLRCPDCGMANLDIRKIAPGDESFRVVRRY